MKIIKPIIRISLLLLIVILGFTIVMPGWYYNVDIVTSEITNRFKSNDEIAKIESQQRIEEEYKVRAKAEGKTVEALKEQARLAEMRFDRRTEILNLTKANQADALSRLLSNIAVTDIPQTLYQKAILSNSQLSFQALLDAKLNCDYASPSGRAAFTAAMNSTEPFYFEKLISASCSTKNNKDQRRLTDLLLARKQYDLLLLVPVTKANQRDFDNAAFRLIRQKDSKRINAVLKLGVSKSALKRLLKEAIRYGLNDVALMALEQGASFSVEPNRSLSASVLHLALTQGNLSIVKNILIRDKEYITRESSGHGDLFRAGLAGEKSTEVIELLFSNGLDVKKFKNNGIHAIKSAIAASKPIELKMLINKGLDADQLTGSHTLIEFAQKKSISNLAEIVEILKQAGVPSNALELARKYPGKYGEPKCNFDLVKHDFSSGINAIEKYHQTNKPLSTIKSCEAMVINCTATSFNLDDCMNAVPVCTSETDFYCCNNEIKSTYLEARCAGLSSHASVFRIEGLSTVYTVPVILKNER